MDAGVQGHEASSDASGPCPSHSNYRDLEGEETPEQRLERQKNALLTMISVRELKALLGEMEGRMSVPPVKSERQIPKRIQRPIRKSTDRILTTVSSARRRNAALKAKQQQELGPQRITTFCFDRLEIGDFKLTAPDERCAVVPGTNWVRVDADRRIIIYQFIIARREVATPYNVTVNVPFASIAAIFCGFPEVIIKLNRPAIQASCYQAFGNTYQPANNLDVTEGQLAIAHVHKTVLRRSTGTSFQEVLLAADLNLFSAILSNGNHLSASSSLYSNYMYNNPQGILSDYGPSLHHSSYLGGVVPQVPIASGSVVPHLTYSAPMMNMGAGGVQLEARREDDGEIQLTEMQPMQLDSSPINNTDETDFRDMFDTVEAMEGNGDNGGESRNKEVKKLPSLQLSPVSAHSSYVSPLLNTPYTGVPMSSSDGFMDLDSSLIPRSTSSSLYALSGSPVFPPSNSPTSTSSYYVQHSLPPYSFSNPPLSSSSSSLLPSSSYPFHHSSSFMTPSPLLPLSPFFSFSSLNTPTSVNSPAFWNATMSSLRMEEFDSIRTDLHEDRIEDAIGDVQHREDVQHKDSLEQLMILKEAKEEEPDSQNASLNEEGLMDNEDVRAKYIPSEYSFSSLCNYDAH